MTPLTDLPPSPEAQPRRSSASSHVFLILIALVTAVSHFILGTWYWSQWVNKEKNPPHPPLELRGEDYL